ncbi:MTH1187 family thiamine-binding protein [Pyrodictium abyssi]|uniref:MTH1187 family thiamine-binding protein n=1 Tax=Pyrodictium abyssi TaxID=54256 RepID=A0ABN6ZSZ4_9CREN|nr:MTH1187 family thiamine-binding protein [Pyrodictium abyssi]
MPIVSLKVLPVGVGTSLSRYIARIVALLEAHGYKPIVTPDTTVIQVRDLSEVGAIVRMVHDELYSMGVPRMVTIVMVDDRRDAEESSPEELVQRVARRVEEERRNVRGDVHGVM